MRRTALGLALLLSATSFAQVTQTQPTHEQVLNQVFANLASHRDLAFTITGTERVGDRLTPFDTTVLWRQTGEGAERTLKLSLRKRTNNVITSEVRANGTTIYSYDFINRTYSASSYHEVKDPRTPHLRDATYHSRLLATMSRVVSSTGPDSYIVRLLQDALGDPAGMTQVMGVQTPLHYRSWMPGRVPHEMPATLPPTTYPDPVVPERTRIGDVEYGYTPSEKHRYFLYDGRPRRSLIFHVYQPETTSPMSEWSLSRIFFGEANNNGGRNRLTEWTMTVTYPTVNPADTTYESQFDPYTDMRGWRPLASPGSPRG